MRTVDLILRKRGGEELSVEELQFLVNGYTTGEISDYQIVCSPHGHIFQWHD